MMLVISLLSTGAAATWLFYRLCRSIDRGLR
jgi:hypothetical protein